MGSGALAAGSSAQQLARPRPRPFVTAASDESLVEANVADVRNQTRSAEQSKRGAASRAERSFRAPWRSCAGRMLSDGALHGELETAEADQGRPRFSPDDASWLPGRAGVRGSTAGDAGRSGGAMAAAGQGRRRLRPDTNFRALGARRSPQPCSRSRQRALPPKKSASD